MRLSTFAALWLICIASSGCVSETRAIKIENASPSGAAENGKPVSAAPLQLNETRISMNVEGGFIRSVGQQFSDELNFQMRIAEMREGTTWSPLVGACLKDSVSEQSVCMQFLRVPGQGADLRAELFYLKDRQTPRQNVRALPDHRGTPGQAIDVTVQQRPHQLVFLINGKEETFPIDFKAAQLLYHCSSAMCEFTD